MIPRELLQFLQKQFIELGSKQRDVENESQQQDDSEHKGLLKTVL
jgi:hypothetical protein